MPSGFGARSDEGQARLPLGRSRCEPQPLLPKVITISQKDPVLDWFSARVGNVFTFEGTYG